MPLSASRSVTNARTVCDPVTPGITTREASAAVATRTLPAGTGSSASIPTYSSQGSTPISGTASS